MARRKADIARIKKTMHVLPETAKFIENTASSKGIFESSVIDEAIALLRKTEYANCSSVA
jgi:hypothetical protein